MLSNAHLALVERKKIVEYLLNAAHPDNGGKARFFIAHGFQPEDWEQLALALRNLILVSSASRSVETAHGTKHIVDGAIQTPLGTTPWVRTVWIVDGEDATPRLVTAYPHER